MTAPLVSVIVPVLDEADNLLPLLRQLAAEETAHEVIVVDGGSVDDTLAIARRAGARVLSAPRGRGQQLKAGVDEADGDVLLFLHADSRFPAAGLAAIVSALEAEPEIVGGNFRLLFDGNDDFSRWLDGFYAWIRSHGIYYGDSAIFVRREVYDRLGGIRPIALMEDYDFVRRLEKAGPTIYIDAPVMVTSSRRFEGRRRRNIVWGWIKIHLLYHMGVKPATLARLYDSERRGSPTEAQGAADPLSRQSYS